ncbi:MAG: hypothetical protein J6D45_05270 [Clostridia bacterium]|nr:hypothetical protein [Clostridia bacterium]
MPPLPCGLVVGGGGEVIDEVSFADQPLASVGICDELALVDRGEKGMDAESGRVLYLQSFICSALK